MMIRKPKNNDRALFEVINNRKYMVLFNLPLRIYVYVPESALMAMVRNSGNDKFYVVRSSIISGEDEYNRKPREAILGRRSKLTGEFELIWGSLGENKPTPETATKKHVFRPLKKDVESILNVLTSYSYYKDDLRRVKPGPFSLF